MHDTILKKSQHNYNWKGLGKSLISIVQKRRENCQLHARSMTAPFITSPSQKGYIFTHCIQSSCLNIRILTFLATGIFEVPTNLLYELKTEVTKTNADIKGGRANFSPVLADCAIYKYHAYSTCWVIFVNTVDTTGAIRLVFVPVPRLPSSVSRRTSAKAGRKTRRAWDDSNKSLVSWITEWKVKK